MPGIDASIPLGIKQPDQMSNLSSLLGVAKGAQEFQSGGIALREKQGLQQVMADPSNYTDADGNIDMAKARQNIMAVAPTTGTTALTNLLGVQKAHTEAVSSLNKLGDDNRTRVANVLSTIPTDADPKLVNQSLDALGKAYGGRIDPWVSLAKQGYQHASQQGPQATADYFARVTRSVLPQTTQRELNTPNVAVVDDGQRVNGYNMAPGVAGMPQGSQVLSVQKQLPPTTPTVGPNNQPGYVGPQPVQQTAPMPGAQPGVRGNFVGKPDDVNADIAAIRDPQERANAQAAFQEQARRTPGFANGGGFVPSGPVPGANESKAATVQMMNEHYTGLNKQAENSQLIEGLLGNIKSLAPGAITGTEQGRKSYVTGLLNALHLGNQATGDLQNDTDLLEKNIAQLGLNTPSTTDAMRTIVGAARPHGTMHEGAIEEAASQLLGQVRANRAIRNSLAVPKSMADKSGDPSAYQAMRQHLEEIADPRAWQFQAMDKEGRSKMMQKLSEADRKELRGKIHELEEAGLLK